MSNADTGSAGGSGRVEKLGSSRLEALLRIGQEGEVRETVDYSQLMDIIASSVPDTMEVRWVGVNNPQQLERHLSNGYAYVIREDGIATTAGLERYDAAGHIIVGDCVLMACSKEARRKRHRDIQLQARNRLDATARGEEFRQELAKKPGNRIELFNENEQEAHGKK